MESDFVNGAGGVFYFFFCARVLEFSVTSVRRRGPEAGLPPAGYFASYQLVAE